MDLRLQLFFICASFFTFFFIIGKIQKSTLNIEDAIIWILWAILLLIFSLFPIIPEFISSLLGFQSMSNFLFSLFIFFLYILLFYQSFKISKLREQHKDLIQQLSIKEYEDKLRNKKDGK